MGPDQGRSKTKQSHLHVNMRTTRKNFKKRRIHEFGQAHLFVSGFFFRDGSKHACARQCLVRNSTHGSARLASLIQLFLTLAPHKLFALLISVFLNKNCLLKLLFSILSISVMWTCPPSPHPTPIKAQFFNISQPMAPAPTRK